MAIINQPMTGSPTSTVSGKPTDRIIVNAERDYRVLENPLASVHSGGESTLSNLNPSQMAMWPTLMAALMAGTLTPDHPDLLALVDQLTQAGILPGEGHVTLDDILTTHDWLMGMPAHGSHMDQRTVFETQLWTTWGNIHAPPPLTQVIAFDALNQFNEYVSYSQWVMDDQVITLSLDSGDPVAYVPRDHRAVGILAHHTWSESVDHSDPVNYESAHTALILSDDDRSAIQHWLTVVFPQGVAGLSDDDIIWGLLQALQSDAFKYQADIGDEWASMASFFNTKQGDCEEFSHAFVSALSMVYESMPQRTCPTATVMAGLVGSGIHVIGHSVVKLAYGGRVVAIDPSGQKMTAFTDVLTWDTYVKNTHFKGLIEYTNQTTTVLVSSNDLVNFSTSSSTSAENLNDQFQAIYGQKYSFDTVVSSDDGDYNLSDYNDVILKVMALELQRTSGYGDTTTAFQFTQNRPITDAIKTNPFAKALWDFDQLSNALIQDLTNVETSSYLNHPQYNEYRDNNTLFTRVNHQKLQEDMSRFFSLQNAISAFMAVHFSMADMMASIGAQLGESATVMNATSKQRQKIMQSFNAYSGGVNESVNTLMELFEKTIEKTNEARYQTALTQIDLEYADVGTQLGNAFFGNHYEINAEELRAKLSADYYNMLADNRLSMQRAMVDVPHFGTNIMPSQFSHILLGSDGNPYQTLSNQPLTSIQLWSKLVGLGVLDPYGHINDAVIIDDIDIGVSLSTDDFYEFKTENKDAERMKRWVIAQAYQCSVNPVDYDAINHAIQTMLKQHQKNISTAPISMTKFDTSQYLYSLMDMMAKTSDQSYAVHAEQDRWANHLTKDALMAYRSTIIDDPFPPSGRTDGGISWDTYSEADRWEIAKVLYNLEDQGTYFSRSELNTIFDDVLPDPSHSQDERHRLVEYCIEQKYIEFSFFNNQYFVNPVGNTHYLKKDTLWTKLRNLKFIGSDGHVNEAIFHNDNGQFSFNKYNDVINQLKTTVYKNAINGDGYAAELTNYLHAKTATNALHLTTDASGTDGLGTGFQRVNTDMMAMARTHFMLMTAARRIYMVLIASYTQFFEKTASQLSEYATSSSHYGDAQQSLMESHIGLAERQLAIIQSDTTGMVGRINELHKQRLNLIKMKDPTLRGLDIASKWSSMAGALLMLAPTGLTQFLGIMLSMVSSVLSLAESWRGYDLEQTLTQKMASFKGGFPSLETSFNQLFPKSQSGGLSTQAGAFTASVDDLPRTVVDYTNAHQYINPNDPNVQNLLNTRIFPNGRPTHPNDVVMAIHRFMADHTTYVSDGDTDDWASVGSVATSLSGDCEDLSNLEHSLILAALGPGMDPPPLAHAAHVTMNNQSMGHVYLTVELNGSPMVLDPSLESGQLMSLVDYQKKYQVSDVLTYTHTHTNVLNAEALSSVKTDGFIGDVGDIVNDIFDWMIPDDFFSMFIPDFNDSSLFDDKFQMREGESDEDQVGRFVGDALDLMLTSFTNKMGAEDDFLGEIIGFLGDTTAQGLSAIIRPLVMVFAPGSTGHNLAAEFVNLLGDISNALLGDTFKPDRKEMVGLLKHKTQHGDNQAPTDALNNLRDDLNMDIDTGNQATVSAGDGEILSEESLNKYHALGTNYPFPTSGNTGGIDWDQYTDADRRNISHILYTLEDENAYLTEAELATIFDVLPEHKRVGLVGYCRDNEYIKYSFFNRMYFVNPSKISTKWVNSESILNALQDHGLVGANHRLDVRAVRALTTIPSGLKDLYAGLKGGDKLMNDLMVDLKAKCATLTPHDLKRYATGATSGNTISSQTIFNTLTSSGILDGAHRVVRDRLMGGIPPAIEALYENVPNGKVLAKYLTSELRVWSQWVWPPSHNTQHTAFSTDAGDAVLNDRLEDAPNQRLFQTATGHSQGISANMAGPVQELLKKYKRYLNDDYLTLDHSNAYLASDTESQRLMLNQYKLGTHKDAIRIMQEQLRFAFIVTKILSDAIATLAARLGDDDKIKFAVGLQKVFESSFGPVGVMVQLQDYLLSHHETAVNHNFDVNKIRYEREVDVAFKTANIVPMMLMPKFGQVVAANMGIFQTLSMYYDTWDNNPYTNYYIRDDLMTGETAQFTRLGQRFKVASTPSVPTTLELKNSTDNTTMTVSTKQLSEYRQKSLNVLRSASKWPPLKVGQSLSLMGSENQQQSVDYNQFNSFRNQLVQQGMSAQQSVMMVMATTSYISSLAKSLRGDNHVLSQHISGVMDVIEREINQSLDDLGRIQSMQEQAVSLNNQKFDSLKRVEKAWYEALFFGLYFATRFIAPFSFIGFITVKALANMFQGIMLSWGTKNTLEDELNDVSDTPSRSDKNKVTAIAYNRGQGGVIDYSGVSQSENNQMGSNTLNNMLLDYGGNTDIGLGHKGVNYFRQAEQSILLKKLAVQWNLMLTSGQSMAEAYQRITEDLGGATSTLGYASALKAQMNLKKNLMNKTLDNRFSLAGQSTGLFNAIQRERFETFQQILKVGILQATQGLNQRRLGQKTKNISQNPTGQAGKFGNWATGNTIGFFEDLFRLIVGGVRREQIKNDQAEYTKNNASAFYNTNADEASTFSSMERGLYVANVGKANQKISGDAVKQRKYYNSFFSKVVQNLIDKWEQSAQKQGKKDLQGDGERIKDQSESLLKSLMSKEGDSNPRAIKKMTELSAFLLPSETAKAGVGVGALWNPLRSILGTFSSKAQRLAGTSYQQEQSTSAWKSIHRLHKQMIKYGGSELADEFGKQIGALKKEIKDLHQLNKNKSQTIVSLNHIEKVQNISKGIHRLVALGNEFDDYRRQDNAVSRATKVILKPHLAPLSNLAKNIDHFALYATVGVSGATLNKGIDNIQTEDRIRYVNALKWVQDMAKKDPKRVYRDLGEFFTKMSHNADQSTGVRDFFQNGLVTQNKTDNNRLKNSSNKNQLNTSHRLITDQLTTQFSDLAKRILAGKETGTGSVVTSFIKKEDMSPFFNGQDGLVDMAIQMGNYKGAKRWLHHKKIKQHMADYLVKHPEFARTYAEALNTLHEVEKNDPSHRLGEGAVSRGVTKPLQRLIGRVLPGMAHDYDDRLKGIIDTAMAGITTSKNGSETNKIISLVAFGQTLKQGGRQINGVSAGDYVFNELRKNQESLDGTEFDTAGVSVPPVLKNLIVKKNQPIQNSMEDIQSNQMLDNTSVDLSVQAKLRQFEALKNEKNNNQKDQKNQIQSLYNKDKTAFITHVLESENPSNIMRYLAGMSVKGLSKQELIQLNILGFQEKAVTDTPIQNEKNPQIISHGGDTDDMPDPDESSHSLNVSKQSINNNDTIRWQDLRWPKTILFDESLFNATKNALIRDIQGNNPNTLKNILLSVPAKVLQEVMTPGKWAIQNASSDDPQKIVKDDIFTNEKLNNNTNNQDFKKAMNAMAPLAMRYQPDLGVWLLKEYGGIPEPMESSPSNGLLQNSERNQSVNPIITETTLGKCVADVASVTAYAFNPDQILATFNTMTLNQRTNYLTQVLQQTDAAAATIIPLIMADNTIQVQFRGASSNSHNLENARESLLDQSIQLLPTIQLDPSLENKFEFFKAGFSMAAFDDLSQTQRQDALGWKTFELNQIISKIQGLCDSLLQNKGVGSEVNDSIALLKEHLQKNLFEGSESLSVFKKSVSQLSNQLQKNPTQGAVLSPLIKELNDVIFYFESLKPAIQELGTAINNVTVNSKQSDASVTLTKALNTLAYMQKHDALLGGTHAGVIYGVMNQHFNQKKTGYIKKMGGQGTFPGKDALFEQIRQYAPSIITEKTDSNDIASLKKDHLKTVIKDRVTSLVNDAVLRGHFSDYRPVSELITQFSLVPSAHQPLVYAGIVSQFDALAKNHQLASITRMLDVVTELHRYSPKHDSDTNKTTLTFLNKVINSGATLSDQQRHNLLHLLHATQPITGDATSSINMYGLEQQVGIPAIQAYMAGIEGVTRQSSPFLLGLDVRLTIAKKSTSDTLQKISKNTVNDANRLVANDIYSACKEYGAIQPGGAFNSSKFTMNILTDVRIDSLIPGIDKITALDPHFHDIKKALEQKLSGAKSESSVVDAIEAILTAKFTGQNALADLVIKKLNTIKTKNTENPTSMQDIEDPNDSMTDVAITDINKDQLKNLPPSIRQRINLLIDNNKLQTTLSSLTPSTKCLTQLSTESPSDFNAYVIQLIQDNKIDTVLAALTKDNILSEPHMVHGLYDICSSASSDKHFQRQFMARMKQLFKKDTVSDLIKDPLFQGFLFKHGNNRALYNDVLRGMIEGYKLQKASALQLKKTVWDTPWGQETNRDTLRAFTQSMTQRVLSECQPIDSFKMSDHPHLKPASLVINDYDYSVTQVVKNQNPDTSIMEDDSQKASYTLSLKDHMGNEYSFTTDSDNSNGIFKRADDPSNDVSIGSKEVIVIPNNDGYIRAMDQLLFNPPGNNRKERSKFVQLIIHNMVKARSINNKLITSQLPRLIRQLGQQSFQKQRLLHAELAHYFKSTTWSQRGAHWLDKSNTTSYIKGIKLVPRQYDDQKTNALIDLIKGCHALKIPNRKNSVGPQGIGHNGRLLAQLMTGLPHILKPLNETSTAKVLSAMNTQINENSDGLGNNDHSYHTDLITAAEELMTKDDVGRLKTVIKKGSPYSNISNILNKINTTRGAQIRYRQKMMRMTKATKIAEVETVYEWVSFLRNYDNYTRNFEVPKTQQMGVSHVSGSLSI